MLTEDVQDRGAVPRASTIRTVVVRCYGPGYYINDAIRIGPKRLAISPWHWAKQYRRLFF